MATYVKYYTFVTSLTNKTVDAFGTVGNTDTFKAVIHTDAPVVATDTTVSNWTQITGANGYTTDGTDIIFNSDDTSTAGTITANASDVTWTASGGNLGSPTTGARYFSLYSSTANKALCSFDYGVTFAVATGETMTLDFGTILWTLA